MLLLVIVLLVVILQIHVEVVLELRQVVQSSHSEFWFRMVVTAESVVFLVSYRGWMRCFLDCSCLVSW